MLVLLDVNETLSDLSPLDRHFESRVQRTLWFAAVLRDAFGLSMTGRNPDFAAVARAVAVPLVGADTARVLVDELAGGLSLHSDVVHGLRTLREAGVRVATFSNGSASVARGLLEGADAATLVEECLAVSDAPAWKPDPRSYAWALERLGVGADETWLLATHPWDLDGAARAGLHTGWVRRGAPVWPAFPDEESPFRPPDAQAETLADLATLITADR